MKNLKKYGKLYLLLAKQNIKTKMEFRVDFIISSIAMIITNIAGVFTFFIIFQSVNEIKGIGYYEIIFIYAFFLIAISPQQIFIDNIWNIWRHLISGTFIKYYLRPIDSMFYYMSETIDLKGVSQLIIGIVMIIYSASKLNYEFSILSVILLLVLLISSSIIMMSLMVIAAATGFWILDPHEIISLIFKVKDFSKYPLDIYNKLIRGLFTFVIPFGFLAYYPAIIFINGNITIISISTPIIAVITLFIARLIWKSGLLVYNSTGS